MSWASWARPRADIFERLGDIENQVRALGRVGGSLWWKGDTQGSYEVLRRSMDLIVDRMESAVGAEVLTALASYYWRTGKPLEAEATLQRARPIVEQYGDFHTRARHLSITAGNRLQMGDIGGQELNEQVLQMYLDRGESGSAASAYNNVATHQLYFEPVEKVLAKIDEGVEFVQSRGLSAAETWTRMTRLESLFPLGRLREALTEAEELFEMAQGGQAWTALYGWQHLLRDIIGLPALDPAASAEAARGIDDPQVRGPVLTASLVAAANRGESALAEEIADELWTAFEGDEHVQALNFPLAADKLIAMGRVDQVKEMNLSLGSVWRYQEAVRRRTDGVIAEAEGRLEDAVEAFRESIAISDVLGHRYGAAWAGVPLVRVLFELGRDTEAEALLDTIEPSVHDMGAGRMALEIAEMRGTALQSEAN